MKEIYNGIRRKTVKESLKDGKRWIITTGGVPQYKVDAEELKNLVALFEKELPKIVDEKGEPPMPLGLINFITGERYNWYEMKELARRL